MDNQINSQVACIGPVSCLVDTQNSNGKEPLLLPLPFSLRLLICFVIFGSVSSGEGGEREIMTRGYPPKS